jgi:kynureninase
VITALSSDQFIFPQTKHRQRPLYFAGHSLGLMPKSSPEYVQQAMTDWGKYGVEGHFEGDYPWLPYHENVTQSLANLVGAKTSEVVAMNSLTVNLHLALVSFYKPTKNRFKILIEANSFPSDKYAVDSQAKFHGFDPRLAIIESHAKTTNELADEIKKHGEQLALVMIGNCNYLSGQKFDFSQVVIAAQKVGAYAGFNLAHGAGNLHLQLHDWQIDFAVWCSYKYLNAGPGGIAGFYIHEKHHQDHTLPKFTGWWGHDKKTRFKMGSQFMPIPNVESWQLSNPPIWQLASLRSSLEIFDQFGMKNIRQRGDELTSYFESQIQKELADKVKVVTPKDRGSMLCLQFKKNPKLWIHELREQDIYVDFREPDIIRATPAPLYCNKQDIDELINAWKKLA